MQRLRAAITGTFGDNEAPTNNRVGKKDTTSSRISRSNQSNTRKLRLLSVEDRNHKRIRARWNILDYLLGTRRGQVITLTVVALLLILVGAATWKLTGGIPDMYDTTWDQAFWFSWGMFFDPGTQMGFPANVDIKFKVTAVVFSVFGFVYNLILLGLIVEMARISLDGLQKRRNRIVLNDHVLVLGWTEKTLFILKEMLSASRNKGSFNKIVVLADVDELQMWKDIHHHFKRKSEISSFIPRRGHPDECEDLIKASALSASDIVVLSHAGKPRHSDLDVVRIVVALAALPERPTGNVIVEVRVPETSPVVGAILPGAEGILARDAVSRVLCLMALQPTVGDCMESLMSFVHGEEIYCKTLRELGPAVAPCRAFGEASKKLRSGIGIGVVRSGENKVVLAPPDDYELSASDRLLVLAHSERDISYTSTAIGKNPLMLPHDHSSTSVGVNDRSGTPKSLKSPGKAICAEVEERRADQCIILVGWNNDMMEFLQLLDEYMAEGSKVHVLSELTVNERNRRMEANDTGVKLQNMVLQHHVGPTTSLHKLASLPYTQASAFVMLSEDIPGMQDPAMSDAACLACTVTVGNLLKGKYPPHPPSETSCRLICEVLDPRTERVLKKNGQLRDGNTTFFHSNALETGMFAMASAEPAVFNTLATLLEPNDQGNVVAVPAREYLQAEDLGRGSVPFRELFGRARARGEVLIGWKITSEEILVLNPPNRDEPVPVGQNDEVLVVRQHTYKAGAKRGHRV